LGKLGFHSLLIVLNHLGKLGFHSLGSVFKSSSLAT